MTTGARFTLLLLLALAHTSAFAEVHRFDFGTADSPLRNGFTRVTADSAGDRADWIEVAEALETVDYPVPRTPFPPPIYTTDLRQDSLQSRGSATLRVRAGVGEYRVWALVGTGGGGWSQVWDVQLVDATSSNQARATFFGGDTARILRLDATADDDGYVNLTVKTDSRWSVNAMVIARVAEWPGLREEMATLEREVTVLPDDVLKDWTHTPHQPSTPSPQYTAEEERRGFVIYQRPWVTPVWPNSVPRRDEIDPTLRVFLSPNEYEPLTFSVLPLKDLENVEIEVSDLQSDAGKTFPREQISVRYVQYKVVRPNYKTFGTYYRAPDLLPTFTEPQDLTARENFRVWLTLHAKADAAAGMYRGRVILSVGGEAVAEMPLVARVLPIQLEQDESVTYSTYYRHPSRYLSDAPDEFSRRWWRKKIESDAASMVAHGYNGFRPDVSARFEADGRATASLKKWNQQLQTMRSHGMDVDRPSMADIRPAIHQLYRKHMGKEYGLHLYDVEMPPEAFFTQVTELVKVVEAERKSQDLPELLYSLVDEPASTENSVTFTRRIYEAAKRVEGIRTYVTVDPGREGYESLHGVVDVWASPFMNRPNVDREALASRGIEVWCYPNAVAGENDHTPVAGARMTYGFARWRAGVPGLIPWIFESWGGDPENYLDALQSDMFNHTTDDADVLPCTLYEAYREGIDDNRYLTTLERAIERTAAAGLAAEAEAARVDLDFVRESVPIRDIYQYETGWADESFDVYRWVLARRIMILNDALSR